MGLFRNWSKKKREKAAELQKAQAETAKAQAQAAVPRREVTPKPRVDPDRPGWGAALGQEMAKAREERDSQQVQ